MTPISAGDPAFRDALQRAGMPISDLSDGDTTYFALPGGAAFGGIAGTGADRLLRSVVVPEATRGAGIGPCMVAALESEAKRAGADRLWLLTTDAAGFFDRIGWRTADRTDAPDAIRGSAQFASICPASATLMVRDL